MYFPFLVHQTSQLYILMQITIEVCVRMSDLKSLCLIVKFKVLMPSNTSCELCIMKRNIFAFQSVLIYVTAHSSRVSHSHCHKNGIKTDAPSAVVWDVVRAHELTDPAHRMRASPGTPGYIILNKPSTIQASSYVT